MTVSIFTPMHKYVPEFFMQILKSVLEAKPFEWVILLNGEILEDTEFAEFTKNFATQFPFIKFYREESVTNNVGYLKARCCELCTGDILLELDYDDYLVGEPVQEVLAVFESNPNVHFAYSNAVLFTTDGNSKIYSNVYGWSYRPYEGKVRHKGAKVLNELISFEAEPQYLRRIEFSPNHLKAFRRTSYFLMGGYDKKLEVGDDHDLMCRFYITFGPDSMYHINKCLYFQRIYEGNTHNPNKRLGDIQKQVDINYINHAAKLFEVWADKKGYLKLDLGGRFNAPPGFTTVDLLDADIIMDLEKPWDAIEDNSVGILRAYHILEHLHDPIHFFNEAYRVLVPGGLLMLEVPSTEGAGAFSDPTHVKFFNLLSFEYYTNEQYAKFIRPQYKGKFQVSRLVQYNWSNPNIPIVSGQFIALKGWYDLKWAGVRKM